MPMQDFEAGVTVSMVARIRTIMLAFLKLYLQPTTESDLEGMHPMRFKCTKSPRAVLNLEVKKFASYAENFEGMTIR